jgi:hypothetical protein
MFLSELGNGLGQFTQALQSPGAAFGLGLLGNSGPSPMPVSFGQAVARAGDYAWQRQAESDRLAMIQAQQVMQLRALAAQQQNKGQLDAFLRNLAVSQDGNKPVTSPLLANLVANYTAVDPRIGAELAMKAPGLLGPAPQPELSEAGKKVRDLEAALGRKLTDREALTINGGGALFEAKPDELDKVLSPNDLRSLRRPDGTPFAVGTTMRTAQDAGAMVVSDDALKRKQQLDQALGVLVQLKGLQGKIDQSGLIAGVGSNILARFANGIGNAFTYVAGTQSAETRALFKDLSKGTVAPLIRTLGESGALSDEDVERALALLPENSGALPDSTTLANSKLNELANIFQRAAVNLSPTGAPVAGAQGGGVPEYDFDPRTGKLVPRQR